MIWNFKGNVGRGSCTLRCTGKHEGHNNMLTPSLPATLNASWHKHRQSMEKPVQSTSTKRLNSPVPHQTPWPNAKGSTRAPCSASSHPTMQQ